MVRIWIFHGHDNIRSMRRRVFGTILSMAVDGVKKQVSIVSIFHVLVRAFHLLSIIVTHHRLRLVLAAIINDEAFYLLRPGRRRLSSGTTVALQQIHRRIVRKQLGSKPGVAAHQTRQYCGHWQLYCRCCECCPRYSHPHHIYGRASQLATILRRHLGILEPWWQVRCQG